MLHVIHTPLFASSHLPTHVGYMVRLHWESCLQMFPSRQLGSETVLRPQNERFYVNMFVFTDFSGAPGKLPRH
jgi:hypothetical protein